MSPERVSKESTQSRLPSEELLASIYLLDTVKQFGPQKFKQVHQAGIRFEELVEDPQLLPLAGRRAESFREQLRSLTDDTRRQCRDRAAKQIRVAESLDASIVTYEDPEYPDVVYESNDPVPAIYVRGSLVELPSAKTVACVGSRKIREPYESALRSFAETAAQQGFAVVSGFANGADTVAHVGSVDAGGATICVMPGGLDRPFPPENKTLWRRFLETETRAVFVSEFLFGRGAESLTLRKRNKLIVAFSRGVLVSQSAAKGGSMNAYRFAREQRKPLATFLSDGLADTTGNEQIERERSLADAVFPVGSTSDSFGSWLSTLS